VVRVWHVGDRKQIRKFERKPLPFGARRLVSLTNLVTVYGVAVIGKGEEVVAAHRHQLVIWNMKDGSREEINMRGAGLAVSPDGRRAICFGLDGVIVWDVATRQTISKAGYLDRCWWTVGPFLPDSRLAVSGGVQPGVIPYPGVLVWDTQTARGVYRFEDCNYCVKCVAVSRDGKWTLTTSPRGVRVWDTRTGKRRHEYYKYAPPFAFAADSRYALSSSPEGAIYLWEIETGMQVREYGPWRTVAGSTIAPTCMAVSPDGHIAAVGLTNGTIRLLAVPHGTPEPARGEIIVQVMNENARCVAATRKVYTSNAKGRLVRWRMGPEGRDRFFVLNPDGVPVAEYDPKSVEHFIGNDVELALYRVNSDTGGLKCKDTGFIGRKVQSNTLGGDAIKFENVAPGRYIVAAYTVRQVEASETIKEAFLFYPDAEAKGYYPGALRADAQGVYEITAVRLRSVRDPTSGMPIPQPSEIDKRYTYTFCAWTFTTLTPGEETDRALLVLCTDPRRTAAGFPPVALLKEGLRKGFELGAKQALEEGAIQPALSRLLGEAVSQLPASNLIILGASSIAGEALAAVLLEPDNPDAVFSAEFMVNLATGIVAKSVFAAYGITGTAGTLAVYLAVDVAPAVLVAMAERDTVRLYADNDDITMELVYDERIPKPPLGVNNAVVRVHNGGGVLWNLRLSYAIEAGPGNYRYDPLTEVVSVLRPGDCALLPFHFEGARRHLLLRGRIEYQTEPIQGTRCNYEHPLRLYFQGEMAQGVRR